MEMPVAGVAVTVVVKVADILDDNDVGVETVEDDDAVAVEYFEKKVLLKPCNKDGPSPMWIIIFRHKRINKHAC